MLWLAKRSDFGACGFASNFAHARVPEDIEPLGIRRHQAVFDAVVDHLDKVAGAARPAVQIAIGRGAAQSITTWCRRNITFARGQRLENRIETLHRGVGSADHEAVTALQTPD